MSQKSLRKNTVYNILKTFSSIAFPLITFPYITRVLQPENVGRYNFSNSIVSYFSLIATLGVTTYAIRECSKVKESSKELGRISGEILSINLMTTIIAYALLGVLLLVCPKLIEYRLLIIIQSTAILFTTLGADWLNMASEDFKYITIRTVGFQMLSLLLMFVFVRKPSDYIIYAIITVISSNGANLVNIVYRRKFCQTKLTLHMNLRKHLPPIMGLFAMLVAQQIFVMSDTTIIGLVCGDYSVGLYSSAVKIYSVVNQVVASITWVVMPQLSSAYACDNIDEIKKILIYVIQFTALIGLPCVIGIFMLSSEIIVVSAGNAYINAGVTLKILAITLLTAYINNFLLNINILAAGKDKVGAFSCMAAAMVNIILNIIFIPKYGIEAAAITTIISQIIVAIICIQYIDNRIHIFQILQYTWKPMLGCMGIIFVILISKNLFNNPIFVLAVSGICGMLVYFIILIALKHDFVLSLCHNLKGLNIWKR